MKSRLIVALLSILVISGGLHAEDYIREKLRSHIERERKNIDGIEEALSKAPDSPQVRAQKKYEASAREELKRLEARLAMADRTDDSFREEIATLYKNMNEVQLAAEAEANPERKKVLGEQQTRLHSQINALYAELNARIADRLEKKVGRLLKDEPFDRLVEEVGRDTLARVTIDASVGTVRLPVTLQEKDVTLERALNAITDNANAGWRIEKGEIRVLSATELSTQAMRNKLRRKVTFEFVDTPLDESLNFLRSLSNVTMIVDPKVNMEAAATINLRVTDMDLLEATEWILRLAGLKHTFAASAMYIYKANDNFVARDIRGEVLADIQKGGKDVEWKADIITKLSRMVSFEFVDTPFDEAIGFLNSLTRVNIVIDPKLLAMGKKNNLVTLRVTDMRLYEALFWICNAVNTDYDLRNQAILINPPKEQKAIEVVPIPVENPKAAGAAGADLVLTLANGNKLQVDRAALNDGAIRELLERQINDPAADGVLYYNLKSLKADVTRDEWRASIARIAPNVKVDFDDKFNLLIVLGEDTKALRKVASLMQTLSVSAAADKK